ncbi:MAG: DUF192 domain-containing protein [bacterium]|nr:DUF192 domain-containing protein [bacterium]
MTNSKQSDFMAEIPIIQQDNIEINGVNIKIELADTKEKQEVGLMNRTELCENCGMLFIFDEEGIYNFWNMNTYIPLDAIYIAEDKKIVEIKSLPKYICHLVETKETCLPVSINPTKNAKYVLEVNAGFTKTHNIKVGNLIKGLETLQ